MIPGTVRDPKASLSEVFISRQGEAKFQGERQLFIRFGVCPLRCRYCDQPDALIKQDRFRIEKAPGSGTFLTYKNPVHPGGLWQVLQRYHNEFDGLHSVSLTGGEPLLYPKFINELIPFLATSGLQIFLETAGIHIEALQAIRHRLHTISMDIKIPSTTQEDGDTETHKRFLQLALERADHCYTKIVVGENTPDEEMHLVGRMIAEVDTDTEVYLQELWKVHADDQPPSPATMTRLKTILLQYTDNVFLSKQQHKLTGDL